MAQQSAAHSWERAIPGHEPTPLSSPGQQYRQVFKPVSHVPQQSVANVTERPHVAAAGQDGMPISSPVQQHRQIFQPSKQALQPSSPRVTEHSLAGHDAFESMAEANAQRTQQGRSMGSPLASQLPGSAPASSSVSQPVPSPCRTPQCPPPSCVGEVTPGFGGVTLAHYMPQRPGNLVVDAKETSERSACIPDVLKFQDAGEHASSSYVHQESVVRQLGVAEKIANLSMGHVDAEAPREIAQEFLAEVQVEREEHRKNMASMKSELQEASASQQLNTASITLHVVQELQSQMARYHEDMQQNQLRILQAQELSKSCERMAAPATPSKLPSDSSSRSMVTTEALSSAGHTTFIESTPSLSCSASSPAPSAKLCQEVTLAASPFSEFSSAVDGEEDMLLPLPQGFISNSRCSTVDTERSENAAELRHTILELQHRNSDLHKKTLGLEDALNATLERSAIMKADNSELRTYVGNLVGRVQNLESLLKARTPGSPRGTSVEPARSAQGNVDRQASHADSTSSATTGSSRSLAASAARGMSAHNVGTTAMRRGRGRGVHERATPHRLQGF